MRSWELADWLGGCTGVIHLAGVLGTSELFDPELGKEAVEVNVGGELNLLHAAHEPGLKVVNITLPADSGWPSVYRATKLCALELADAFIRAKGVQVTHVRAFNAFGEGQAVAGCRFVR